MPSTHHIEECKLQTRRAAKLIALSQERLVRSTKALNDSDGRLREMQQMAKITDIQTRKRRQRTG